MKSALEAIVRSGLVLLLLATIILVATLSMAFLPPKWMWYVFSRGGDHAAAFLFLAIVSRAVWPRLENLRTFAMLGLLGIGIELVQAVMRTGHSAEWGDVLADLIGAACGLMLTAIVVHRVSGAVEGDETAASAEPDE